MIQAIAFLLVLGFPFIIYLISMFLTQKEQRGRGGIAAGVPRQPREARAAGPGARPRPAKVRSNRVEYCGKTFRHFALALVGSQSSCRYCTYVQEAPTPIRPEPPSDFMGPRGMPPPPDAEDERDAAVREAEEIIERWKQ
ncbi:MAG TPA: hypothetical protein PKD27_13145 [Tepidiformaceae bacterium]|nr:hypothetical protein [Tepidiformaceae bacterium]